MVAKQRSTVSTGKPVSLTVKVNESVTNATVFASNITVAGEMGIIQSAHITAATADALNTIWTSTATQNTPAA